jgi:predicted MPP superfamily phosphohydrolase
VRRNIAGFIAVIQSVLFLTHLFLYETWIAFWGAPSGRALWALRGAWFLLAVSFAPTTLWTWRSRGLVARLAYTLASVWLGMVSFFVAAACLAWTVKAIAGAFGRAVNGPELLAVLAGFALLASLYALANAAWTRVRRVTVRLPNLPASWRGRTAALVTDMHLGPIRGVGFARQVVRALAKLRPAVVFIAGDLYNGTAADLDLLASPWAELSAPLGAYFVTGNHEEFSDRAKYIEAVSKSGVRVLNNEKVTLDGVQVVGVHFGESAADHSLRGILRHAKLQRDLPSILLTHAPNRLALAEEEGISLQLSGHTHGGQMFPFTWITSRIYGRYVYGLNRLGNLLVYTSWGAGTWGPPLRFGTQSEIVLIEFA